MIHPRVLAYNPVPSKVAAGGESAIRVGDVVLIIDNQLIRAQWPMGTIVQVFPRADGPVRSVRVKVGRQTYERPTTKIVLMKAIAED